MNSIKEVFDHHCKDLVVDKALLTKVRRYAQLFVNKNEHHINFFGGVLMGVDPIRFTHEDRYNWFSNILGVDEEPIKLDIHRLESINTKFIVSSDIMNLSCIYLMHRFFNSKLGEKDRESGAQVTAQIMNYKFFTSILTGWFRYNADPQVAQTTYAMLTRKFGLKVTGSWGALIEKRSYDIVKRGGLHYRTISNFKPDKAIVDMTNDIWGRVKSILKYIRDVFTTAQNMPEYQIRNTSNTIELDGEVKLRDKTRMLTQYKNYMANVVIDKRSFIKEDLVSIVLGIMTNTPRGNFERLLEYFVDNSSVRADKNVLAFMEIVIDHGINYIVRNPEVLRNRSDLANMVRRMRGLYTAAKSSDPEILKMRKIGDSLASRGARTKNKQVISASRNTLALYIFLRTMVMNYYR